MTIEEGTFIIIQGIAYLIECILRNNQDKIVGVYCSDSKGNERYIPECQIDIICP